MSAASAPRPIADGVLEIDTLLGGWTQTTAGYLLSGDAPLLVETGSQSSVPVVLDQLARAGLGPADLAGIAVTHIHLDHAGGVGDLAAAFPAATIYVHERGARHLVDPSRLIASAGRVYGDLLDSLYGRMSPVVAERVQVLGDGDRVDCGGGRQLVAVDSPGHAKHHLGFLDELSGLLFAGDAVGVELPGGGVLRPATPPPDFDFDLALASLERFAAHRPRRIALAHYGVIDEPVDELLGRAADVLRAWVAEAERAWRAGEDVPAALAARFAGADAALSPEERQRLETLNGVHANAAGITRFLAQRAGNEHPGHEHGAHAHGAPEHAATAPVGHDESGPASGGTGRR